ncbi:MAG: sulfatase activating formylglycine-generating enzyme, partial [Gammaproteobacteria bacterium]
FDDLDTEINSGFNGNLNAMGWYVYNDALQNSDAVTGYEFGTKLVAKKQANTWGLYDMHGNVFEWNWDWLAAYTGNVTDSTGPASGSSRVFRGGGWGINARFARSAFRYYASAGLRFNDLSFRLVLPQVQ